MKHHPPIKQFSPAKRMLLYARVSTEEQTKGNYPSCESQLEELEAECQRRGWTAYRTIKDEGYTAATLKRPGLTEMRWLVQSGEIDGVMCTWYDRLTRSREFYTLDNEFQSHQVEFITLHDPADTRTAAGRFMESMIVAAKTYERDQTSEKVRTKMRMRLEKGLHQGGLVPFGFLCDPETKLLRPDPERVKVVEQLFQVYVDTQSDFAVRDWLKAHGIAAPHGNPEWTPSSLRDLLMNRRYIGEIEVNKSSKDVEGLPEPEAYHIVPAPHEPLVSREVFELAQVTRKEKALKSPKRGGKGKGQSYSRNQCHRVYPLQGILVCGICGHAMSPHYVYHKANPGKGRRSESYIYHYLCAQQMKYRQGCDHANRVLAKVPEGWIVDRVTELVDFGGILEDALSIAWAKTEQVLQPTKDTLALCRKALEENQRKIDELMETARTARGALLDLLSETAHELKLERERLRIEQRQLGEALLPLNHRFDAKEYREVLADFPLLCGSAEPQELQHLLRLTVRRMDWVPSGEHRVHYYLPTIQQKSKPDDWNIGSRLQRSGPPDRRLWSNQSPLQSSLPLWGERGLFICDPISLGLCSRSPRLSSGPHSKCLTTKRSNFCTEAGSAPAIAALARSNAVRKPTPSNR